MGCWSSQWIVKHMLPQDASWFMALCHKFVTFKIQQSIVFMEIVGRVRMLLLPYLSCEELRKHFLCGCSIRLRAPPTHQCRLGQLLKMLVPWLFAPFVDVCCSGKPSACAWWFLGWWQNGSRSQTHC
eukprot:Nitzschia sp. Nitz4//scaffold204_size40132//26981//27579//NITZ4_007545-RA/size40132-exonerate_est2genome-gene-0.29-mRNA-1//-1//CDS//3329541482//2384//frame0